MKKKTATLLVITLFCIFVALIGSASDIFGELFPYAKATNIIATGNCGEIDETKGMDGKQVKWTQNKNGQVVISGIGAMKNEDLPWENDLSINSVLIEDGVTNIGNHAFYCCRNIESVTIPDSVTNIGNRAFYFCSNLVHLEMGNGISHIGSSAFSGCSKLKSVIIPENVTSIGGGAFSNCRSLTNMKIPKGVTYIDGSMFSGCSSLISVKIPDSVTAIDVWAFSECDSLSGIIIPDSVTEINRFAFDRDSKPVLYGFSNSFAQQWAKTEGISFRYVSQLTGDPDSDGKISSADARLALRACVKLESYVEGSAQFVASDVDADGKISADDARTILRVSVGLESFA